MAVMTARDAWAVCQTLDHAMAILPTEREVRDMVSTPMHALTGLFQEAQSRAACAVLEERGLPLLNAVVQECLYGGRFLPNEDLLFILKVMAAYHYQPAVRHTVYALRQEIEPEHYVWPVIFAHYAERDHPHTLTLIEKLGDPLPRGWSAVGMLHLTNGMAGRGDLAGPVPSRDCPQMAPMRAEDRKEA